MTDGQTAGDNVAGDKVVENNPGGSRDQGQSQPQGDTKAPGVPEPKSGGPDAPTPPGQTAPKSE